MYTFASERRKWVAIRNLLLINGLSFHFSKVWISPLMHTLIVTDNSPAFTHLVDLSLEKVQRAGELHKEYAWSVMAAFLWPFVDCNKDFLLKQNKTARAWGQMCVLFWPVLTSNQNLAKKKKKSTSAVFLYFWKFKMKYKAHNKMHMRTWINRHENYVKNYATIEVFINKGVLLVKFRKCSYSLVCMLLFVSLFISMVTKTVKTAILDNNQEKKNTTSLQKETTKSQNRGV